MKKSRYLLSILLVLVMAVSLSACGAKNNQPQTTPSENSTAQTAGNPSSEGYGTGGTMETETREGVIGGLVNDMESGMTNQTNPESTGNAANQTHQSDQTNQSR